MDRGTFDILLNVFRTAVTREHAEGGRRAGEEIRVVSGETILIIYIETDYLKLQRKIVLWNRNVNSKLR